METDFGIPVDADAGISREETRRILCELAREWAWEGRQLGRVELISDGQFVQVCSYEKPVVTVIPRKTPKGA
jgi:hypothetical protein